ncbi:hypothetical protein SAMN04487859_1203 [Roseovarius lutimaris]|uniref:Uncharacterized protein n=1 Tax=Roseovarius lutimaris TaxID=1005928 RepID=A0A1I5FGX0_9RHOB|nr:hypothetical protein SAMN04487859_1203 [Roseovarius lutimaris]
MALSVHFQSEPASDCVPNYPWVPGFEVLLREGISEFSAVSHVCYIFNVQPALYETSFTICDHL